MKYDDQNVRIACFVCILNLAQISTQNLNNITSKRFCMKKQNAQNCHNTLKTKDKFGNASVTLHVSYLCEM